MQQLKLVHFFFLSIVTYFFSIKNNNFTFKWQTIFFSRLSLLIVKHAYHVKVSSHLFAICTEYYYLSLFLSQWTRFNSCRDFFFIFDKKTHIKKKNNNLLNWREIDSGNILRLCLTLDISINDRFAARFKKLFFYIFFFK